jgi:murein DD-endopeptidase MepM/ murein hydrolase activator NlpD
VRRGVAAFVALATFAVAVGPAGAATSTTQPATATTTPESRQREIDAELNRLRGELSEIDAKSARAVAELRVTRRHREELDGEVAGIDRQLATAQQELDGTDAALATAVAQEEAADAAVENAERALKEATAVLQEQAVQAFINFGSQKSVGDLLAEIEDVNDAPRVVVWVQAVAERQTSVVEEHRRLQQDTTQLRVDVAAARDAVALRRDQAAARKADIERVRAERTQVQGSVAQEAANEQRLVDNLNSTRAKAAAEVAELERASAAIKALLQRKQSGQTVVPVKPGFLRAPVSPAVINSTFGYRIHPIFGDSRLHSGVDFNASTGTPVYAAADGTVIYAGWQSGYGNTVVIDHGGAIATLYAHNSAIAVTEGAKVKKGQQISSAGATGNVTGPHVHFEVRVNGTPVDPLGYL